MISKSRYTNGNVHMQGNPRCCGIDESLKSRDPMKWVGMMNLARAEAEQNIFEGIPSIS